ncbi:MAG: hypothetical protein HY761_10535 [Candidatus Omnitrophica bacterium]|nr:hypothetical protein [Candidatus Omnitrophota bacterium]
MLIEEPILILFGDDNPSRHLGFRIVINEINQIDNKMNVVCHHYWRFRESNIELQPDIQDRIDNARKQMEHNYETAVYDSAIKALNENPYDIVVTDLNYEDTAGREPVTGKNKDGIYLAEYINAKFPGIETMLITAYGRELTTPEEVVHLTQKHAISEWVDTDEETKEQDWFKIKVALLKLLERVKDNKGRIVPPEYTIESYIHPNGNVRLEIYYPRTEQNYTVTLTESEGKVFQILAKNARKYQTSKHIESELTESVIQPLGEDRDAVDRFCDALSESSRQQMDARLCPYVKPYETDRTQCDEVKKKDCPLPCCIKELFHAESQGIPAVRQHIYNMRQKFSQVGLDNVMWHDRKYGYVLPANVEVID